MTQPIYAQLNTLVRVREMGLLSRGQKLALLHANNLQDAVKMLEDSGYFTFAPPDSPQAYALALTAERQGILAWVRAVSPTEQAVALFLLKDTVRCLKAIALEQLSGKPYEPAIITELLYPADTLLRLFAGQDEAGIPPSWAAVVKLVRTEYGVHPSPVMLACRMEAFYHEELIRTAAALEEPAINAFVAAYTDLYHLSVLLQCRAAGIRVPDEALADRKGWKSELPEDLFKRTEQEQDQELRNGQYALLWEEMLSIGSSDVFDLLADNYLLRRSTGAKLNAFGILPLCGFMVAKLMELKDLRMILSGKCWGLPVEEIEKRVRISYEL